MSYPEPERTPMSWQPPTGPPSGPFDPPPPMGPPPPAPPRRRRRWPWILGATILFLMLAAGGCTWLALQAARPPIDAANEWLALVDEQRFDEAYDALCPGAQARLDRAATEAELGRDFGPGLAAYRISSYQNTNGRVSVGGDVTVGLDDDRPITLFMDDEGGDWRVCGCEFADPGTG